ncbi:MAG: hypothetical protein ACREA3_02165 [Nitrosotalea sp.]
MSEIEPQLLRIIKERLDLLIYLQLRRSDIESMTLGQQIFLLKRLGFTNQEMARLFGTTTSYVSSEITRQKGKKSNE